WENPSRLDTAILVGDGSSSSSLAVSSSSLGSSIASSSAASAASSSVIMSSSQPSSAVNSSSIAVSSSLSSSAAATGSARLKITPSAVNTGINPVIEGIPDKEAVKIFTMYGRLLVTLYADTTYPAADNKIYGRINNWFLTDEQNESLEPGVYILQAGDEFLYFTVF
ncbi:MAG TPA: hypothetical protein VKS21_05170, partial [Spirochaetota bacterium]|nr:hypothetical protein [Spirochaetota bacterium]